MLRPERCREQGIDKVIQQNRPPRSDIWGGQYFLKKNSYFILTNTRYSVKIKAQKGGEKIEQEKEKGDKKAPVEKVLLITAILQLIQAIIDLIKILKE